MLAVSVLAVCVFFFIITLMRFFFFKQKTAYEMRISDWSSDVCSSDLKEPVIPADLLDQLLAGSDAAAALDQGGLLDTLKKALAERALNAEMDHHLGDDEQAGNSRNGYGRKTVTADTDRKSVV